MPGEETKTRREKGIGGKGRVDERNENGRMRGGGSGKEGEK